MPSPLNDPRSEEWFQRLNAPLKRMPAEERAALHSEITQHLDQLAAANIELGSSPEEAWGLALTQFGDPGRIGRRLLWEWRRSQNAVSQDMAAVLYGLAAHVAITAAFIVATVLVMSAFDLYDNSGTFGTAVALEYLVGVPILTGLVVGRRFPQRAVTGLFYAAIAWPLLPLMAVAATSVTSMNLPDALVLVLWPACWLTLGCGAAYLASARKRRQWYRPRWEDLRLKLPTHEELQRRV